MQPQPKQASVVSRVDRWGRNVLTLNRDREFKELRRLLALEPSDHVLDIGSGDGFWTSRFSRDCAQVVGVEPDLELLEYARTLNRGDKVAYVRGVAERLPFPDGAFTKVVSVSAMEHFADPWQGLKEMVRVLKPGGRLAVSVDSLLPENAPASFSDWHRQRHYVTHYFHQKELERAMADLGVACQSNRTVHLFGSRTAAWLRQEFIRRPRVWLALFPLFYAGVRVADRMWHNGHGQIIIVGATR